MTRIGDRRSGAAPFAVVSLALGLIVAACEVGGPPSAQVNPGPAVPSPIPTRPPYVWDTRAELEIWTNNVVSHGPVAVQGDGPEAFIRIDPASSGWVLRGPDLEPFAEAVRTVHIRYRWAPDSGLQSGSSLTGYLSAYFETVPFAPDQPAASTLISPTTDWTELDLTPGSFRGLLNVRYVYLRSLGWNRGVFEINSIQFVQ